MSDDRVTAADLGKRWDMSPRTLDNWRSLGIGPAYIKVGGLVRYRMADVITWEASRLHKTG